MSGKIWNFATSFNWVLCCGCFLSVKFCGFQFIPAVAPCFWAQITFFRKVKDHNQNLGTKSFLDWYNCSSTPQFLQKNLWFLRPTSIPGHHCFLEMIKSVKYSLKDYNLYWANSCVLCTQSCVSLCHYCNMPVTFQLL